MVVDTGRIKGFNIGQLADYIAMIGLAQIRLDSDLGSAPTILRLFAQTNHDAMPPGRNESKRPLCGFRLTST